MGFVQVPRLVGFPEISGVRCRYMESRFSSTMLQVVVGGVLVFLAGILIGSS